MTSTRFARPLAPAVTTKGAAPAARLGDRAGRGLWLGAAVLAIGCGSPSAGTSTGAGGAAGAGGTTGIGGTGATSTTSTASGGSSGSGGTAGSSGGSAGGTAGSSSGGTGGATTSTGGAGGASSGGAGGTGGATTGTGGGDPCVPAYVAASPAPIGWASMNGGTTGGGQAAPVVVTTLAEFNDAAKGTTPAVLHVKGNLEQGTATIGSNKTILGCSGSNATLNGHVELKGSTNVIVRNIAIVGYNCAPPDVDVASGGQCQNGQDAVTVEKGSKNIWFDHDAISDGSDGNLDITHGSDFITVSYTKFFYSSARTDPNDTGAKGHRFSNLIGGSDSNAAEDTGHLNISWHHDWWGKYVVEREPRVRFGKNHLWNDLWTATGNDYCIGVGVGASILSENNAFVDVKTPIDTTSFVNANLAKSSAKSAGNLYMGTTGAAPVDLDPGSVFTPGYSYELQPAAGVQADVQANAGPQ